MDVQRIFTGAPWEKKVGYCRAVKAGPFVAVSGTAPVGDDGKTFAPGDAYAQTRRCIEIIQRALGQLGLDLSSVVRTRMYVTDISRWEDYGRAHQEFFGPNPPATTLVEIAKLVSPDMLIEVEADAVCPSE